MDKEIGGSKNAFNEKNIVVSYFEFASSSDVTTQSLITRKFGPFKREIRGLGL